MQKKPTSVAVRLPLFEAITTRYTSGAVQDPCSRLRHSVPSQTREATKADDDCAEEIVYDGEEKVADEDKASLEDDDADRTVKAVHQCTSIKSRWIVPLLLNEMQRSQTCPMRR